MYSWIHPCNQLLLQLLKLVDPFAIHMKFGNGKPLAVAADLKSTASLFSQLDN